MWSRANILALPSADPRSGIYGWYFSELPSPHIDTSGCKVFDGMPLLYVGIAPKNAASTGTLRGRIIAHYTGNQKSTLRFTLGVLLADHLDLHLEGLRDGRYFGSGEIRLNEWMDAHAFVSFVETAEPWHSEREVIRATEPPLNLAGHKSNPFGA